MNRSISQLLAVAILAGDLCLNARADASPGEVDFGRIGNPVQGGNYVEITLGRNLISLASRLVEKQKPEVGQLLRSVESIRVNVVGLTDENRSGAEKRVLAIRAQLDKQGWQRIVTVQQKGGEDVGIFIKARGDEALEGIVITVLDSKKQEAVLINVVGDIKPEQVAALGEALHIDPLKKAGSAIQK